MHLANSDPTCVLPVLHLSYDEHPDWLEVGHYGTVLDRQGHDRWRSVSEHFGYLLDAPVGREVGFKVLGVGTRWRGIARAHEPQEHNLR